MKIHLVIHRVSNTSVLGSTQSFEILNSKSLDKLTDLSATLLALDSNIVRMNREIPSIKNDECWMYV